MLPGDPEGLGGGIERLVAQQPLDRADVRTSFEQGRRATMAERMDAVAMRHPRALLWMVVDFLGCPDRHWRVRIESGA